MFLFYTISMDLFLFAFAHGCVCVLAHKHYFVQMMNFAVAVCKCICAHFYICHWIFRMLGWSFISGLQQICHIWKTKPATTTLVSYDICMYIQRNAEKLNILARPYNNLAEQIFVSGRAYLSHSIHNALCAYKRGPIFPLRMFISILWT